MHEGYAGSSRIVGEGKTARNEIGQLRDERAAVAAGKQNGLSGGAKATEAALNKYFKGSDDKVLSKVDSVLGKTQAVLEDTGSKYNYQLGKSDVGPKSVTLGYAGPLSSNIKLTSEFFGASNQNQVVTLIHEPAHIQGINIFPFQRETYDDAVFGLSRRQALNNADSYALYADH